MAERREGVGKRFGSCCSGRYDGCETILDRGSGCIRDRALVRPRGKKPIVSIVVMTALLSSAVLALQVSHSTETAFPEVPEEDCSIPTWALGLTPHDPILLDGNAAFLGDNSSTGITWGSGTADDPYIIEGWEISSFPAYGIEMRNADVHFVIEECYVHGGIAVGGSGLYLHSCSNGTIRDCITSENDAGIFLQSSHGNILINNTCSSNNRGILAYYSGDNSMFNNACSLNFEGIILSSSQGDFLVGNIISSTTADITLWNSDSAALRQNELTGCGVFVFGEELGHFNTHSIDATNTVNGDPIYYYKNQTGITAPAGAGQVLMANCADMRIANQNLDGVVVCIELAFCTGTNVTNNTCTCDYYHGWYGIYLVYSSGNHLINNKCSDFVNGYGIYLLFSDGNDLIRNDCSGVNEGLVIWYSNRNYLADNLCLYVGSGIDLFGAWGSIVINNHLSHNGHGVYIAYGGNNLVANNTCSWNIDGIYTRQSSNNDLIGNNCSSNNKGIYLAESDNYDNLIQWNVIADNSEYGIDILSGNNNRILNNSFLRNNGATDTCDPEHVQACDDGNGNFWNSTEGCGNYWSDWTSPDVNMDGIVDSPYLLDGSASAKDYCPQTTAPVIPEFSSGLVLLVVLLAITAIVVGLSRRSHGWP